jgi:hypothetical protein
MSGIFIDGQALVVTTRGPGSLHLLTYSKDPTSSFGKFVRPTSTSNAGTTRFLVSFTHNYDGYAFHWDGAGEAVYGIGANLERKPVGRSWKNASAISWTATTVTTIDATSIVAGAPANSAATVFVIPDLI